MSILHDDNTPTDETMRDLNALRDMIRSYPGGVASYDPEKLVSSSPVEPYKVLPSSAGILQLLAKKKIEPIDRGKYRIVAPIDRFPGGMFGARRLIFYIKEGVPVPDGSLGHSTVYSEADNTCLRGSMCR